MWKNPLNPNAIIFLLKVKFLQTLCIEMSNIIFFKNLFSFLDIFSALVHNIDLNL